MTSIFLAAAMFQATLGAGIHAETYSDAQKESIETGKPLVVMVSATWCGPCKRMKHDVLPQVEQDGVLDKVAFSMVDVDMESDLAGKLTGGGPVPQLVMYRQTEEGWKKRKLIGWQSVSAVEDFIIDGVSAGKVIHTASATKVTAKTAVAQAH